MSMVRIVEMGPRDGLQNEPQVVPLATKLELIERLADAGLREIEATWDPLESTCRHASLSIL